MSNKFKDKPWEKSGNFFDNGNEASAYNCLTLNILVCGLVPVTTNIWFANKACIGCRASDRSSFI